jgi:CheY-like chemotaxis protein
MSSKILLADDSITIQKVIGIIFAGDEYELTIVDNGSAALVKALANAPDILLVDAVMPGMTGYEVCDEFRREPSLKNTPIVLLTGAFEPFDEEKAHKCGADDFISKPFESQNLIDKVTGLIEQGKLKKAVAPAPPPPVEPPFRPVSAAASSPAPFLQPPPSASSPAPAPVTATETPAPVPTSNDTSNFSVEVIEGSLEDDIWGAFDLEDLAEAEGIDESAEQAAASEDAFATEIIEEQFSFSDEVPEELSAVAPDSSSDTRDDAIGMSPEEQFGVFLEESRPESTAPEAGFEYSTFSEEAPDFFAPPAAHFDGFEVESSPFDRKAAPQVIPDAPSAKSDFTFQFAPETGTAPPPVFEETLTDPRVTAPFAEAAPSAAAPSPAYPGPVPSIPTESAVSGSVTLSDEQLAALVSSISRDLLEKIAWEVVPDLAERIIREEIQKIKAGVA